MKFKDRECENQLAVAPAKLTNIAFWADHYAQCRWKRELTVTRVKTAVCGDSGVHEAGRAVDLRNECPKGRYLFTPDEAKALVDAINLAYPRTDGKLVAIHHSFHGAPMHFHLQIQASWV